MRYSTLGKPRRVTDAQIARILAWHRARCSAKQLSRELGISISTLRHIVRSGGAHYKQACPDTRLALRAASSNGATVAALVL